MSSGVFDAARLPVGGLHHGNGKTALVLVTMAAAMMTIRVSTGPYLQARS